MGFYFERFEDRKPPEPIQYSPGRELLYQYLATISLVLGAWYISWRWASSLNYDALGFSIALVMAETCAYVGLVLFTINLWKARDVPLRPPPFWISECVADLNTPHRPIVVDVFFTTYDEDPGLVRLSVRDARKITYPYPVDIRIHVLDDGRRPAIKQVAEEEEVNYITREDNIGFKTGNLRHALAQTSGDFILVCDADTRPFPTILERTLGYFRDADVAWVQTPRWFYDLPEGKPLRRWLEHRRGKPGFWIGRSIETLVGPVRIGRDPFVNDPRMFYDVIQRRRNWANASFCCGAGSIHRREAVMEAMIKAYARQIDREVRWFAKGVKDEEIRAEFIEVMTRQVASDTGLPPYQFRVNEDLYTSILLHSDPNRKWKSVLHPWVESKMLSPQDLPGSMARRFKHACGTLDIAFHDHPVFMRGMKLPRRLMYASTLWNHFSGLWNAMFLLSPAIFLYTGIAPVSAYSLEFFTHLLPFLFFAELALMVGTWGIEGFKGRMSDLAFFPIYVRALGSAFKRGRLKFPSTPSAVTAGNPFHQVVPQVAVIVLTLGGILYSGIGYLLGWRDDFNGWLMNVSWGVINIAAMSGVVYAAFWKPDQE
jgi:cellulose synthase (UDP-forming)